MTAAEAAEAATRWGGRAIRPVSERENAVWEAALPDGRAALRLHRAGYQDAAAIAAELWWCAALARAGLPVARPLAASDGTLVVTLSTGRSASAVAWIDGRPLGAGGVPLAGDPAWQAAAYRALGALVARVHAATDALRLPQGFVRPAWDAAGLVGEAPLWGRFWEHPAASVAEAGVLSEARAALAATLDAHAAEGGDFGLIHADLVRENVLVRSARSGPDTAPDLALIDFDDAGSGFRLYDLATALAQNLDEPAFPSLVGALLEGYASVRPLPLRTAERLPWFILMRCCASVGWMVPRVAPGDPAHRRYIERAVRFAPRVLAGQGFG